MTAMGDLPSQLGLAAWQLGGQRGNIVRECSQKEKAREAHLPAGWSQAFACFPLSNFSGQKQAVGKGALTLSLTDFHLLHACLGGHSASSATSPAPQSQLCLIASESTHFSVFPLCVCLLFV